MDVSRRNFVAGSSIGAASLALAGTGVSVACADEASPAAAAPVPLNPQDFDFCSNTMELKELFTEWQLGPLTLRNRIVKPAGGSDTAKISEECCIEYYRRFAAGGAGMVWVENLTKSIDLATWPLDKLAEAVHAEGASIGMQVDGYFRVNDLEGFEKFNPGRQPDEPFLDKIPVERILEYQQNLIDTAKILKDNGFDAFEINAAAINAPQGLLSPHRNNRTDEYGAQSFENRTRLLVDSIKGIHEVCGEDFPVQVLLNGVEDCDNVLGRNDAYCTVEDTIEIVKILEAAGAASFIVRMGPTGNHVAQFASDLWFAGRGIDGTTGYGNQFDFSKHFQGKLRANHSGAGILLDVAGEIKQAVSVPVGTVIYCDPAISPDYIETAFEDGLVDFIEINRPLTVDPEYVNKLKEGRFDEIAPCTRCMHCHHDNDLVLGQSIEHCRVNATTQFAYSEVMPEGFDPLPAASDKKVMVVGGGPAGMEAARIAAERGYDVTLYEKKGLLGGMLPFASYIKGPHENLDKLNAYLQRQQEIKGVNVVCGTEVDTDLIKAEAPDVVILATGGLRDSSGLAGTAATPVIPIDDIMGAEIGDEVTIIGGNAQAIDLTMYLMEQGKHVNIVMPDPIGMLGKGHSGHVRTFTIPMIYARGNRVWPEASIASVGDGEITITNKYGVDITVKCDAIIEAMDMLPNTALAEGLDGIEVMAAGDCNAPNNILAAIHDGNLAARAIQ